MTEPHRGGRGALAALAAGLATGALLMLLLLPVSGVDTNPPTCSATFGYSVPCGSGLALGAAVVAGLVAAWVVWRALRARRRTSVLG